MRNFFRKSQCENMEFKVPNKNLKNVRSEQPVFIATKGEIQMTENEARRARGTWHPLCIIRIFPLRFRGSWGSDRGPGRLRSGDGSRGAALEEAPAREVVDNVHLDQHRPRTYLRNKKERWPWICDRICVMCFRWICPWVLLGAESRSNYTNRIDI